MNAHVQILQYAPSYPDLKVLAGDIDVEDKKITFGITTNHDPNIYLVLEVETESFTDSIETDKGWFDYDSLRISPDCQPEIIDFDGVDAILGLKISIDYDIVKQINNFLQDYCEEAFFKEGKTRSENVRDSLAQDGI